MFRSINPSALRGKLAVLALCAGASLVLVAAPVQAVAASPNADALAKLGRKPTQDEIAAWDIDVRADFKGLPAGSGSVEDGIDVWEGQCASCHGIFAESNEVFTPLVGGTTDEDIERGTVASLSDGNYPHRTTLMRLSKISVLWDYINRAMPWNQPKSLKPDEVYAVIAYMLNLGDIVDEDFVLSDKNIAEVQARLPNRNGMKFYEPMWVVDGKPDVQGDSCMSNCKTELDIKSFIPDYARNAHGNLAEQNRVIGPTRGVDTTKPAPTSLEEARKMAAATEHPELKDSGATAAAPAASKAGNAETEALAKNSGCLACHGMTNKILGPGFSDVAKRYKGQADAVELLTGRVLNGAQGTWGAIPMPANAMIDEAQARSLVEWILEM